MDADVQNAIQPDGGLHDIGWYLAWTVGSDTAILDGQFTAQQLRDIADHMECAETARIAAKEAAGK